MAPLAGFKVSGLRELRNAMRQAEAGSQKHLQLRFKALATTVAAAIAGNVTVGPTGHAAASVRPRATATSAGIVAGGQSAPYFPWLDFGGSTGPGHKPGQGGSGSIKRPIIKAGRYIYPTIAAMGPTIEREAGAGIADALEAAGWERT